MAKLNFEDSSSVLGIIEIKSPDEIAAEKLELEKKKKSAEAKRKAAESRRAEMKREAERLRRNKILGFVFAIITWVWTIVGIAIVDFFDNPLIIFYIITIVSCFLGYMSYRKLKEFEEGLCSTTNMLTLLLAFGEVVICFIMTLSEL